MRFRLAVALALAAVVFLPTAALGDDVIESGSWRGSRAFDPAPVTFPTSSVSIRGYVQWTGAFNIWAIPEVALTRTGTEAGCNLTPFGPAVEAEVDPEPEFVANERRHSYQGALPFSPDRNGDFPAFVCIDGDPRLQVNIAVRLPAPTVSNVVATAEGRTVTVSWDDMRGIAPDLSGYRVERSIDGGPFEAIATVGPDVQSATDSELPDEGGEASYQVIATRPFVADASPSNVAATEFDAAPAGGDGGAGDDGGTDGTGGGGTGDTGGSGGTTSRPRTGRITTGGRPTGGITVPRVGTPSRNFFPPLLAPPVIDTGFDPELPFEEREPGEESPVLPDELASDDVGERLPGRGLVVPVATGLVLAVWALHLRFLARASQPGYGAERVEILDV